MNTLAQQEIAGYWRQTPITARPDFMILRGEARRLQADQKGVLLNHGKAFRLWADFAEHNNAHYRLRDASCCIGARIIEANADGNLRAMAITAGWRNPVVSRQSPVVSQEEEQQEAQVVGGWQPGRIHANENRGIHGMRAYRR